MQTKFGQKLGVLEFGSMFCIFLCFLKCVIARLGLCFGFFFCSSGLSLFALGHFQSASGLPQRLCYRSCFRFSSAPLHTMTQTASVLSLMFSAQDVALLLFCDKMLVKDVSVVHLHANEVSLT